MGKGIVEELAKEYPLDIIWVGYELHPERPLEGEQLDKLYPDIDQDAMTKNFNKAGANYGLVFNPINLLPNTRLALLATEFAKDAGKFDEFHSSIFKTYFTEGKNIGNKEVIFEIIANLGLEPAKFQLALKDQDFLNRIDENRKLGLPYQIAGLPTFIISGQQKIVGAQSYDFFRRTLDKVLTAE